MNNPFINNTYTPYNSFGQVKTPQQIQQELNEMQQRYTQQYNALNQQVANSGVSPNFYSWKYQENENEIDSLQVPSNGTPFMLVGNGVFWVKQFKNGQPYISTFTFQPLNQMGEPKKDDAPKEDGVMEMLEKINRRLDKLEKKPNKETLKGEVVDNPFSGEK